VALVKSLAERGVVMAILLMLSIYWQKFGLLFVLNLSERNTRFPPAIKEKIDECYIVTAWLVG